MKTKETNIQISQKTTEKLRGDRKSKAQNEEKMKKWIKRTSIWTGEQAPLMERKERVPSRNCIHTKCHHKDNKKKQAKPNQKHAHTLLASRLASLSYLHLFSSSVYALIPSFPKGKRNRSYPRDKYMAANASPTTSSTSLTSNFASLAAFPLLVGPALAIKSKSITPFAGRIADR